MKKRSYIFILLLLCLTLVLNSTIVSALTGPSQPTSPPSGPPVGGSSAPLTLKEQGVCKFISINDASLGNTISANLKGVTTFIRLQLNGKTYKLPFVPNSSSQNADGTWYAEYYTIDPTTSQPLIPPGTYNASCYGDGGTANNNTQTITITR